MTEFDSGVSRDARPQKPNRTPFRRCSVPRLCSGLCVRFAWRSSQTYESSTHPRVFGSRFSLGASLKYRRKRHSDKARESSIYECWFPSCQNESRMHPERYRPQLDSVLRKSRRSRKACRSQLEVITATLASVLRRRSSESGSSAEVGRSQRCTPIIQMRVQLRVLTRSLFRPSSHACPTRRGSSVLASLAHVFTLAR